MVQKKKTKSEKLLTKVELELMNAIWDLKECSVRDVVNALPKSRNLAYTSVATIMKILEQKNFIKSRKKDKAHTFYPMVSRSAYEAKSLKHLTDNLFSGDPSSMVMRLLDESELTSDELKKIRKFLDERLQA